MAFNQTTGRRIMSTHESSLFLPFEKKMLAEGTHETVIRTFRRHFADLLEGQSGMIPGAAIDPVTDVPDADALEDYTDAGLAALPHTVVIRLNGGLGTSMGLEAAKSLLPAKNGLTFLDIIARQMLHFRKTHGVATPLVLMNSLGTRGDSLRTLGTYPGLDSDLPPDFLQHRTPKVEARNFAPAEWPDAPELEWCPPGHGDLYTALVTSGLLGTMLDRGYTYAFVSNSDNLGAVPDVDILGYFAAEHMDFMMEVADRTAADRKGGHLARRKDGRLMLREVAQCPDGEMREFQDIALHRFFNTNSLWINLRALAAKLAKHDDILPLPVIQNLKTLDPRDPRSPRVYQLETAMGSAISLFKNATALRVPRSRFIPVKTTDDLLGLWSDAFTMTPEYRIVPGGAHPDRVRAIALDRNHYRLIDQLQAHFPAGAPSLLDCTSLAIRGDVHFGRDVTIVGNVTIEAPEDTALHIADGEIIRGA